MNLTFFYKDKSMIDAIHRPAHTQDMGHYPNVCAAGAVKGAPVTLL